MLSEDNEENGLLSLHNSFKLHKQSCQCVVLQLYICRLLLNEIMRPLSPRELMSTMLQLLLEMRTGRMCPSS